MASLSESAIAFVTFLCCGSIVILASAPLLSKLMKGAYGGPLPLLLFSGSILAVIVLFYAFTLTKSRRNDQKRLALTQDKTARCETHKGTLGTYGEFAVIGAVFFFVVDRGHGSWHLFAACNLGQVLAFLLLRWILSRPPTPAQIAAARTVEWLSKQSVVRVTPTEIVLKMPWGIRALIGGCSIIMAGMAVLCLMVTFAPGLFGPSKHPGGMGITLLLILFVSMAFFATMLFGMAGPRDLRMDLDTRCYTQTCWKPIPSMSTKGNCCIPFYSVHASGIMDDDMTGVCVRIFCNQGSTSYILQVAWRDTRKIPQVLSHFAVAEEAQMALTEAAQSLRLPPLERC